MWHVERFPWHAAFTAVTIFFIYISFAQPASLHCEEHVYIYISDCLEIVFELLLLPNNTAREILSSVRC